mgnify:CR=1 FL=1
MGSLILWGQLVAIALLCFATTACTTIVVPDHSGGTYWGITRVMVPDSRGDENVVAYSVRNFGARSMADGFSIGFTADRVVKVPLDCRLVVFVESDMQATKIAKLLEPFKGDKVCVTEFQE